MPWNALADPTRRKILEVLATGPRPAGEIVGHFRMTAPAISQHLKALRQAGLVRVRPQGQQRIYELDPQGLAEISVWIQSIQSFWAPRLERLEEVLRQDDQR